MFSTAMSSQQKPLSAGSLDGSNPSLPSTHFVGSPMPPPPQRLFNPSIPLICPIVSGGLSSSSDVESVSSGEQSVSNYLSLISKEDLLFPRDLFDHEDGPLLTGAVPNPLNSGAVSDTTVLIFGELIKHDGLLTALKAHKSC